MSEEPPRQTSRAGLILVLLAVGGSAVGVAAWHLLSNRGEELDTSGFDMSSEPDARPDFPASYPAPDAAAPAAAPTSLSMVKGDAGIRVAGSGPASKPARSGAAAAGPKEEAALSFRDAAIKNERLVAGFVRRMQRKYPSIGQYGKDWAASPELRALRDQYWKEKDPVKFAYGLAKSKDFAKLVKKYAGDPGIRDTLVTGIKEAPPSLTGAASGVFQNDNVVKSLVSTVIQATGLPPSLTAFLDGSGGKAPDQKQMMSDIMNSDEIKKAMKSQPGSVSLEQKAADKAQEAMPNGFRPLGGR